MGGQPDDITQTTEPPRFVRPYIEDVLAQGQNLYHNYTPQYFPGSTVAPISPYTSQATDQLAGFGNSGFNQSAIGGAQAAQGNLVNSQGNQAIQIGANQAGNSAPFYDYLRARAVTGNVGDLAGQPSQGVPQGQYQTTQYGQGQYIADAGGGQPQGPPQAQAQPTAPPNLTDSSIAATQNLTQLPPGSNPYVDELVQRTLQANTRDFQQNALPSIQNQAQLQGGYGGSRQGVAEGIGLQGLADANANAASSIYSNQYNQDINRNLQAAQTGLSYGTQQGGLDIAYQNALMQNALTGSGQGQGLLVPGLNNAVQGNQAALALSPGLQQMGQTGTQNLLAAGDIDNAYRQALVNDNVNRFNFSQAQPWQSLQNYSNAVYGLPGLGGSAASTPSSGGGFAGALGGASAGLGVLGGAQSAGLISAGAASGPIGWGVVGLGALLGSGALN